MKKIATALLALGAILFTGCDFSGYEVDWAPVNLWVKVVDADGNDLLDPQNPDNLIDGATITFKGEIFEASRLWYENGSLYSDPATKAYAARLYGLYLIKDSMMRADAPDGFSLLFGEIDGAADMDEDLVVSLSNGMSATVHYHCSNHNESRLSCKRSWTFNGAASDSSPFTIVVSD